MSGIVLGTEDRSSNIDHGSCVPGAYSPVWNTGNKQNRNTIELGELVKFSLSVHILNVELAIFTDRFSRSERTVEEP